MIDPKFMDEQLGIDRSAISKRYQQVNEPELQSPEVPHFEVDMSYDGVPPEDAYEQEAQQEEYAPEPPPFVEEERPRVNPENLQKRRNEPRPPKLSRPGKAYKQDNQLFEGGPLESQVLAWKKQFGTVYMTEHEGEFFIWRRINRFEYKEVMSIPNTNELSREEMICEVCTLFPYDYSYEHMVNDAGGVPSMLAEQIMQKSGFTRKARVIAL